jgi:hypothetical protein
MQRRAPVNKFWVGFAAGATLTGMSLLAAWGATAGTPPGLVVWVPPPHAGTVARWVRPLVPAFMDALAPLVVDAARRQLTATPVQVDVRVHGHSWPVPAADLRPAEHILERWLLADLTRTLKSPRVAQAVLTGLTGPRVVRSGLRAVEGRPWHVIVWPGFSLWVRLESPR